MRPRGRRRRLRIALLTTSLAVLALAATGALGDLTKLPLNDLNTALGLIPGYPTPAAATEQQNAEPAYDAAPRAKCGLGSHELQGIQGRVPASVINSPQAAHGWNC